MYKEIYFSLFFFFVIGMVNAQEIKPVENAKGFLETRNTLIDYKTGVFSYKIPMFNLISGNFNLPVELAYTANGVRSKVDKPGVSGWGWNLQCGGVVTRTLRGGIPDEDSKMGYATNPIYNQYNEVSDSTQALIEQHLHDGESDIFSAVFNDRKIDFILELTSDKKELKVIPLNRTNVRIDNVPMNNIPLWRITDEDGVQYIFSEKEIMINVGIEETISSNNVMLDTCISSWYLTRIIIPDAPDITFEYEASDPSSIEHKDYIKYYNYEQTLIYSYGKPMKERSFDVLSRMLKIQEAIEDAKFRITRLQLNEEFKMGMETLENINSFGNDLNEFLEESRGKLLFLDKAYGLLTNISSISEVTNEVLWVLNDCMRMINQFGKPDEAALYYDFSNMKKYYIGALEEIVNVSHRKVASRKFFKIYNKLLSRVICDKKELCFTYRGGLSYVCLDKLALYTYLDETIKSFKFEYYDNLLKSVTEIGNGGISGFSQRFSYYLEGESLGNGLDWWGYHNGGVYRDQLPFGSIRDMGLDDILTKEGSREPNSLYTKALSLKKIELSTGGEVELDYEGNCFRMGQNRGASGGIRIKTVVFRDERGKVDSTRYYYERENGISSGNLVLSDVFSNKWIYYKGFEDVIIGDRMEDDGIAVVNTGNNGVIYDYVREESVGRGYTCYYYYAHYNDKRIPLPDERYNYYMNGLIIGQVDYNVNGQMVRMMKNKYYVETFIDDLPDFFCNEGIPFDYTGEKLQVKSSGLWVDKGKMEREYANKEPVLLYHDGVDHVINYYNEYYSPNLEPRTTIVLPKLKYLLPYGGKVVLWQRENIIFEQQEIPSIQGKPHYEDLFSIPQGLKYMVNKTEYQYGSEHTRPIELVQDCSNGDIMHTYTWRVADLVSNGNNPSVFDEMKTNNVLNPAVVTRSYRVVNNQSYLIDEKVSEYEEQIVDGKRSYVPVVNYSMYKFAYKQSPLPEVGKLSTIFLGDRNKDYDKINMSYVTVASKNLVSQVEGSKGERVIVHDQGNGQQVLIGNNVKPEEVDAIDYSRMIELNNYQKEKLSEFMSAWNPCLNSEENGRTQAYNWNFSGYKLSKKLVVKPSEISNRYVVTLVAKGKDGEIKNLEGEVQYSNGQTAKISIALNPANGNWQVLNGTIDLVTMKRNGNIAELRIGVPETDVLLVQLAVLVPEGCSFEATATDRQGRVCCKIDQYLQLERYEYDEFGRTRAIIDRDGNYLQYLQYKERRLNNN